MDSQSAASVAFKADPIAVVVYDYGSKVKEKPTITVFGPFGGWNEARDYARKLRPEREPVCVVMRDPSIWPEPEKALVKSAAPPLGLTRCDGGDGWGCFIPHGHCVCEDEGTPGMRRVENLHAGPPNPETKWS